MVRNYLVSLLVKHLKISRPETNDFLDPGLGGVQVWGGSKPNR